MNYGFVITMQGWRLLAKLLAGSQLEITKIMVGSGKVPEGVKPSEITNLVQPVALATSTLPQVTNRQLSFIVEYRNDLNGGLAEGFWLNEFGIYADDPDNGEILLYYATLGDYPQYVSAFNGSAVDIRRYPISIALSECKDVQLSYPANSLMTVEDMALFCNKTLLPVINGMHLVVTIPGKGWVNSTEMQAYPWQLDIVLSEVTAEMWPTLTVRALSLQVAVECGLAPIVQSMAGLIRVYAVTAPVADIVADLFLQIELPEIEGISANGGGSAGMQALPIATTESLGAVKIGKNVQVQPDGTISVDGGGMLNIEAVNGLVASESETQAMLDSVFDEHVER